MGGTTHMNNQELAEKLTNDIKKHPTVRAIEAAFSELYEESGGDFAIINKIVNIMDVKLQDISVLNEQFENKSQINAMSQLHQIVKKKKKTINNNSGKKGKK